MEDRTGRQPELRQDHPVQRPDRRKPVRRQLARRHRRKEGRQAQRQQGRHHPGPAGHLLPVPLYAGGSGGPQLPGEREARRHPEHRGRHQHRAQPLPDHPAARTGHPGGHRREHDRPGAQKRRPDRPGQTGRGAGLQGCGDERPEGGRLRRRCQGRRSGRPGRPDRQAAQSVHRLRGAGHRDHRGADPTRYLRVLRPLVRRQAV